VLASVVSDGVAQHWVLRSHLGLAVSDRPSWGFPGAVPRPVARAGSSCQELTFSTENYPIVTCPHPPTAKPVRLRAPSLGFRSSSRPCVESTNNEHPTARLTFRPQRFSRSRRFTPPHTSWACFIPQPRPGFALQGLSPLPSRLTSRSAVPSCRWLESPTSEQALWRQIPGPASRALLRAAIRCSNYAVKRSYHSIPSCAFTPSGLSPNTLSPPSQGLRS